MQLSVCFGNPDATFGTLIIGFPSMSIVPDIKRLRQFFTPLIPLVSGVCLGALSGLASAQEVTTLIPPSASSPSRVTGPWGTLEYFPISLEPPRSHLWNALYDERSYWNFGNISQEEAREVFVSLGFSAELRALIDRDGKWTKTNQGLEVDVSDAVIEGLTVANRTDLAKWFRLNSPYFFSKLVINLEGGDYSAFQAGQVSRRTLDLVKQMTFLRRNVLSLMDRAYILRKLGDDLQEKENFLRATFASRGLVARLILDDTSDLDSLVEYWSAGGHNPGVRTLFKGVLSTSGIDKIDLVEFLPPVPRRYLNSFTNMRDVRPNTTPDCFWTSVQFLRRDSSPRFLDALHFGYHLDYEFEKVEGEPRFGDVVCMLHKEDRSFVHSYVEIADEIVFSKNGASYIRPFVLTRRSDMLSVYLDETPYIFESYRLKPGL